MTQSTADQQHIDTILRLQNEIDHLRADLADVRVEAANHIHQLRQALQSALGDRGVLDNHHTRRREVWHGGQVVSWTSAAMLESDRKYDPRIPPFGYYPCSRVPNK